MQWVPVFLLSDVLFWTFVLLLLAVVFRPGKVAAPLGLWQKLQQKPMAMIAIVPIMAFILLAAIDCLHFEWQGDKGPYRTAKVYSVLDLALFPLSDEYETTYSAPFAQQSFKALVISAQGKLQQVYKPLQYPSKQLKQLHRSRQVDSLLRLGMTVSWVMAILTLLWGILSLRYWLRERRWPSFNQALFLQRRGMPYFWASFTIFLTLAIGCYAWSQVYHIFGTTKVGADVFYQSIKSIRTGILLGCLTTGFMLPFALILGVVAGYFGRWIDDVIQFIYITISSIPAILLISAVILMLDLAFQYTSHSQSIELHADYRLVLLCAVLGLTGWTGLCRLLRAETLKLREMSYVMVARTMKVSSWKILYRHIIPNLMHLVILTVVLDFSGLVLAEAVLTYVGVGVDPKMASWGNMIHASRLELAQDPVIWWPLLSAFTLMFILVLAVNIFAEAMRDVLDVRASS
jgi:peptide/nickel transport system permease protein